MFKDYDGRGEGGLCSKFVWILICNVVSDKNRIINLHSRKNYNFNISDLIYKSFFIFKY